jgi:hypothetical protein
MEEFTLTSKVTLVSKKKKLRPINSLIFPNKCGQDFDRHVQGKEQQEHSSEMEIQFLPTFPAKRPEKLQEKPRHHTIQTLSLLMIDWQEVDRLPLDHPKIAEIDPNPGHRAFTAQPRLNTMRRILGEGQETLGVGMKMKTIVNNRLIVIVREWTTRTDDQVIVTVMIKDLDMMIMTDVICVVTMTIFVVVIVNTTGEAASDRLEIMTTTGVHRLEAIGAVPPMKGPVSARKCHTLIATSASRIAPPTAIFENTIVQVFLQDMLVVAKTCQLMFEQSVTTQQFKQRFERTT